MRLPINNEVKLHLVPYTFVLRETDESDNESMDYSLMMLQVGKWERIRRARDEPELELLPLLSTARSPY